MSTFSGISTALSALQSHRAAMTVVGQNVANANTPGYVRQRVELESVKGSSDPLSNRNASTTVGYGVTVATVSRAADDVLQHRVDTQTAQHAMLAGRSGTLAVLEQVTQEPGTNGLATHLNAMWSAWSSAANTVGSGSPDGAARNVVLQKTINVAQALNASAASLAQEFASTTSQAQADVGEVNALAKNVADLNQQITKAISGNGSVNELLDARDKVVTRLSELTGSTAQPTPDGQVDVYVGGALLVQGIRAARVEMSTPVSIYDTASTPTVLRVTDGVTPVEFTPSSGALGAKVEALRTTLPNAMKEYDAIAQKVAAHVNGTQMAAGVVDATGAATTGTPVFAGGATATTGFTAASITISPTLKASQLGLTVAANGPSDGSNASKVANVKALGTASPDAAWSSYVAGLGAQSSSAATRTTAAQQSLTASMTDQQGQTGVSLDDESASLIASQRAYQAAARVMNAVDEMLQTLMSTGLVGR